MCWSRAATKDDGKACMAGSMTREIPPWPGRIIRLHVHQSLLQDGRNAFHDPAAEWRCMSDMMRHYLAGQLAHAQGLTYFLAAPRQQPSKRLPTCADPGYLVAWSMGPYPRVATGDGTRGVRVGRRIGGADLNPYLACAAPLAAGLDGIERKLELEPEFSGDAYAAQIAREIPKTLGEAARALDQSAMLRAAFGDQVIDHYLRAAEWELEEQNRVVTDWELARGYERA